MVDPVAADNSAATAVSVTSGGSDTTPPTVTGMRMLDSDHDGFVDTVTVSFSEPLAACAAPCTSGWSLTDVPGGGSLQSVTVAGAMATLTLAGWTDQPDTAVGLFTIALQAAERHPGCCGEPCELCRIYAGRRCWAGAGRLPPPAQHRGQLQCLAEHARPGRAVRRAHVGVERAAASQLDPCDHGIHDHRPAGRGQPDRDHPGLRPRADWIWAAPGISPWTDRRPRGRLRRWC